MSEYAAKLNMPKVMNHMELRCKVTGMNEFKLRCAIGIFMIKAAAKIIGCKVEVDLIGNKPSTVIDARGATDPAATAKAILRAIQS